MEQTNNNDKKTLTGEWITFVLRGSESRVECTVPDKYWREFLVAIVSGLCGGREGGSAEDDEVMAGVGETTTLECTINFYLHTLITIH